MTPLTDRQREMLQVFLDRRDRNQLPPKFRELQEMFDYESLNAVGGHLKALVRKGYLVHTPGSACGYQLNVQRCPSRLEGELKEAREIILLLMQEALPVGELMQRIDGWLDRVEGRSQVSNT